MVFTRLIDETYRSAARRFLRLWRPMAAWTLMVWLLVGLALSPLLSGAVLRVVLRGERTLLGNEELLAWLLRPEGLGYICLAGALLVMGAVVRYAGLYRIITDDLRRIPADFLAVPRPVATPRFVRAAGGVGMDVHVWTLNRADTMLDAIQAGARGIITDHPVLAIRIREELADLTPVERLLLSIRGLLTPPNANDESMPPDEGMD